jgi:hypothetical protein
MKRTKLITLAALAALAFTAARAADITPAEARAIVKEAYIYGFPLVDNYRIQHSCLSSIGKATGNLGFSRFLSYSE